MSAQRLQTVQLRHTILPPAGSPVSWPSPSSALAVYFECSKVTYKIWVARAASLYLVCTNVVLTLDCRFCRNANLGSGTLKDYAAELRRHEVLLRRFPNKPNKEKRMWAALDEIHAAIDEERQED